MGELPIVEIGHVGATNRINQYGSEIYYIDISVPPETQYSYLVYLYLPAVTASGIVC